MNVSLVLISKAGAFQPVFGGLSGPHSSTAIEPSLTEDLLAVARAIFADLT